MSDRVERELQSLGVRTPSTSPEKVLYFPMKTAIARLGGQSAAARVLKVPMPTVSTWITPNRRARPDDATLAELARLSGVALDSLVTYYARLELYKERESWHRRAS